MHGWRWTAHEAALAEMAREIGFTQISASHEVEPLIKLIGRGDTSVVDAYLSPVLRRYVDKVVAGLSGARTGRRLYFMQSNGGLTDAGAFRGKDAILSGPAGGIVGMARTARRGGLRPGHRLRHGRHLDRRLALRRRLSSGPASARSPACGSARRCCEIHTVAAGGGSVCHYRRQPLPGRAGQRRRGAGPGLLPARRAADRHRLQRRARQDPARAFPPASSGPAATSRSTPAASLARCAEIGATRRHGAARGGRGLRRGSRSTIWRMRSSRSRSRAATTSPATRCNASAGPAASMPAWSPTRSASERVMIHPLAGVLSAYGMGLADMVVLRQRTAGRRRSEAVLAELEARGAAALRGAGRRGAARSAAARPLRYEGSDTALEVAGSDECAPAFEAGHRTRFGFVRRAPVVVETAIVEAVGRSRPRSSPARGGGPPRSGGGGAGTGLGSPSTSRLRRPVPLPPGRISMTAPPLPRRHHPRPRADRRSLRHHRRRARLAGRGRRRSATSSSPAPSPRSAAAMGTEVDPVMLEVMNNLFMAIAEEMGVALQNTASSVNIKERLDFSCALFDRDGASIANAPHIPVHLGSMGDSHPDHHRGARATARDGRGMRPGDVYVLNAPYRGGTHLPDITVIMPVFAGDGDGAPAWFVAARGHHADIGGIAPGSMPPDSRTVARGRRADRQCAARRRGPLSRGGDARAARLGRLAGAQSRPQHRRPQGPDRRLRARRRASCAASPANMAARSSTPIWAMSWPMPRRRCGG